MFVILRLQIQNISLAEREGRTVPFTGHPKDYHGPLDFTQSIRICLFLHFFCALHCALSKQRRGDTLPLTALSGAHAVKSAALT